MTRLIFSEFDIDRAQCMGTRGAVLRLACLVSHSLLDKIIMHTLKMLKFILKTDRTTAVTCFFAIQKSV
jgi:hypothetical protein